MGAVSHVATQHSTPGHGWRHLWASACWSMRFSRLCRESLGHAPGIDAEALQRIFRRCGA